MTVSSTDEAITMLERSMREEPQHWTRRVQLDNVAIVRHRVCETPSGWWVPLGTDTALFSERTNTRNEAFIVVTRDGSSNGWYHAGPPLWWDDAPRLDWLWNDRPRLRWWRDNNPDRRIWWLPMAEHLTRRLPGGRTTSTESA